MVISQVSLCSFCRRRILEYVRRAVYCRDRETRGELTRMGTAWAELARAVEFVERHFIRAKPDRAMWDAAIRLSFQAQPACVSHVLARLGENAASFPGRRGSDD